MKNILPAWLKRPMKFYRAIFNSYEIQLFHNKDDIRSFPVFDLIPYFWDSDISFDIAVRIPASKKNIDETWNYKWELRDLDGVLARQGKGEMQITKKGFRRKLIFWNSGKRRAIVLNNLHPHREYLLYVRFLTGITQSDQLKLASLTVDDRGQWQMQMFLIVFSIIMALIMTALAKGCGM
jgi:hypothetical protein